MLAKLVIFNTDSPSDLQLVVRKSVVNPEILEFSSSPSTTLIYLTSACGKFSSDLKRFSAKSSDEICRFCTVFTSSAINSDLGYSLWKKLNTEYSVDQIKFQLSFQVELISSELSKFRLSSIGFFPKWFGLVVRLESRPEWATRWGGLIAYQTRLIRDLMSPWNSIIVNICLSQLHRYIFSLSVFGIIYICISLVAHGMVLLLRMA